MIEIHLTDQEITDINEAIDDPSHSEKTKIKLLVIRMRHEGAKTGFIAKCLNLHGNPVTNYLNECQAGKLPATLEDRYHKPTSSLDPFLACLKCSFRATPAADAKQAVERIERLTGIRLSESQARRFMKNLGLRLRKTAPIPGKCDNQLQFDFYTTEMLPRLEEARKASARCSLLMQHISCLVHSMDSSGASNASSSKPHQAGNATIYSAQSIAIIRIHKYSYHRKYQCTDHCKFARLNQEKIFKYNSQLGDGQRALSALRASQDTRRQTGYRTTISAPIQSESYSD